MYLAQDTLLDREIAFTLIKTEGLKCPEGVEIIHLVMKDGVIYKNTLK